MNTTDIKQAIQIELLKEPKADRAALCVKYGVTPHSIGAAAAVIKKYGFTIEKFSAKTKEKQIIKKGVKKAKENTYTNHNGESKEIARIKMSNAVVDSGIEGDILTLPNTEWNIEQKIFKYMKNVNFTGVECDETTHKIMKRNLKQLPLKGTANKGYVSEFIYGKVENTYAHMVLDYCGELPKIAKELEYILQNNVLAKNGILAVTFTKQIRGSKNTLLGDKILSLATTNSNDFRCETERAAEAYFNKVTGWNYNVIEFFYYQDKGHTPMALVIIKRIN